MYNDLTFFTNEPERTLYDRFNKILSNNTKYFDVLVGYFRTSGFFKLCNAMQDIEKIRILVGLNVDSKTIELINSSENFTITNSTKIAKDNFENSVVNEFNESDDDYDLENGVRKFIEWLKNGKLELRIYDEAPIHAKVYIMRKEENSEDFGKVITGSSNFSLAGLRNNLEFNVELKDSRDVKFALEKFEELWEKSVDIKDNYIETVESKTWIKSDITPYELFLKTIYEYFKEEINYDKDSINDADLPKEYMKLQYQLDAVTQAKKTLEAYNGVFISDVVGLGKTYICALLAKTLSRKSKKLIICPPVLVSYWKEVMEEFDVVAHVESLGKLEKLKNSSKIDEYEYVFIDEAHRFRNDKTDNYTLLHEICKGKKVVLISATPINNYSTDIKNQIFLFQSRHNGTIMTNYRDIEKFFVKRESELNRIKKGTPEYNLCLRKISDDIRDNLLRKIMIRRTRGEISKYYKEDLEKQGLRFPHLGNPVPFVYEMDEKLNDVFVDTINLIKDFKYSRYVPFRYLTDPSSAGSIKGAQDSIQGFMKSILVKRLESSFYAFRKTLSRFIESYEKFIEMYNSGKVFISKKVNVYDLLDSGDEAKLFALLENEDVYQRDSSEFKPEFKEILEEDLQRLINVRKEWDSIEYDPKLDKFIFELNNNDKLIGNKKIIFTESKETAEYLGENLEKIYGDRVIVFTGNSSNSLKEKIEQSFNPKFNDDGYSEDRYDVLITTDVLAEGINLHRANVVINYDLPWNPTRIMQRVGRINRVGTEFENIYIFNFFPSSQTHAHMSLEDRIIEKLQLFNDTLGEDFKYLSDSEVVSAKGLFDRLNENLDNSEEEGYNQELEYLQLIREIRDNDIKLFEKIKNLPLKAKCAKRSQDDGDKTISFIRKGYLKMFFKSSDDNTKELSFMEAIKILESKKDEKASHITKGYYNQLNKNKDMFDERLLEETIIDDEKLRGGSNDKKMIDFLKWMQRCPKFTDIDLNEINNYLTLWVNGDIPSQITRTILDEIKNQDAQNELDIFSIIRREIPKRYANQKSQEWKKDMTRKQVILSCYLTD